MVYGESQHARMPSRIGIGEKERRRRVRSSVLFVSRVQIGADILEIYIFLEQTFLLCMMTCLIGLSTSAYGNTVAGPFSPLSDSSLRSLLLIRSFAPLSRPLGMSKDFGVAPVVAQVGMFT